MNNTKLTKENYYSLCYDFLKQVEEGGREKISPYYDSAGLITIGVGFNLHNSSVLRYFLIKAMGVENNDINTYVASIHAVVEQYRWNTTVTVEQTTAMQRALNAVWADLKRDRNASFIVTQRNIDGQTIMPSDLIKRTFNALVENIYGPSLSNRLAARNITGLSGEDYSWERLALISLEYNNGNALIGDGLLRALSNGDRFAAWYEIRYRSNGGRTSSNGIAKRRYMESALFGLFDDPNNVTNETAASVVTSFLASNTFNTIIEYERLRSSQITAANTELSRITSERTVSVLDQLFIPIAGYLWQEYGGLAYSGLSRPAVDGRVVLNFVQGDNNAIQSSVIGTVNDKNDLLISIDGAGRVLNGGNGNDILISGKAGDTLIGGDGNDIIIAGGGSDRIYGETGNDMIYGGTGEDIIYGDEGDDILFGGDIDNEFDGERDAIYGGEGFDTFHVDNHDIIYLTGEKDRFGQIYLYKSKKSAGSLLSEAYREKNLPQGTYIDLYCNIYRFEGDTLVVNNGLRIENFKKFADKIEDGNNVIYSGLGIVLRDLTNSTGESIAGGSNATGGDSGNIGGTGGTGGTGDAGGSGIGGNDGDCGCDDDGGGDEGKNDKDKDKNKDKDKGKDKDGGPDRGEAEKQVSPVIIDLNGNGIETTGMNGTYFDHDGDGLKELTGWVGGGDGLLVRDLNGDGVINNGGELFGNNTLLSNGKKAANGYKALAELDDNGDGIIDASDSAWSSLAIWQDRNTNGYTDEGELITLADAGIISIDTGYRNSGFVDAYGNKHKQIGAVTLADGSKVNSVDVWFNVNEKDRINNGEIRISAEISALPNAKGFGKVHDLRQAMAMDAGLKTLLEEYLVQEDTARRDLLLESLIYRWGGVADVEPVKINAINARQVALLEKLTTGPYNNIYSGNNILSTASEVLLKEYEKFKGFVAAQIDVQSHHRDDFSDIVLTPHNSDISSLIIHNANLLERLESLVAAGKFSDIRNLTRTLRSLSVYSPRGRQNIQEAFFILSERQPDIAKYLAVEGSAGNDTLFGSTDIINDILSGGAGNDWIYSGKGDDVLIGGRGNDHLEGGAGNDTYLFGRGDGRDTILNNDFAAGRRDILRFTGDIRPDEICFERVNSDLYLKLAGSTDRVNIRYFFSVEGSSIYALNEVCFSDGTVWTPADLAAKALIGDAGNNRLQAYQGGSTLRGGGGNDNLYGDKGGDTLYGDSGSDGLYGGGGDDVLIGGRGNDHLEGGAGNDTYLFGRGDGRDTIFNNDFAAGRRDILRFTGDIRPDEIRFERVNSDLYLKLAGTTDRVNIRYFFSAEGSSSYALNEVHFSDGTIWTPADLAAKALTGDTGNNRLQAYQGGSTLRGGGGNDNLYGDKGGDTLYGDSGSDGLYGGGGDDVLIGGRGNDHLEGGAGNDTYLFGRGDGRDTIFNNDFAAGRRDILRFTGDIRPDEICFERVNSDLYLKLAGSTDRVNIRYFFSVEGSSIYALNEVCFSDGTVWTPADLAAKALIGDAGNNRLQAYQGGSTLRGGGGNDNLYGDKGDDTLYGDSGSDGLYGGGGDDVLIGGRGNDHLEGGAGNDTYLFGRGDGRDTIFNNDFAAGRHDILRFTGDIRPDEIRFERVNSDLYLKLAGTTDWVNIRYFFSVEGSSSYALNEVHFSDGTVWTPADLAAKALTGDTGNNRLQAYQSGSTLRGGGGNDNLYGDKGDDTLYGDSGSDGLYGGKGDDVLIGGRGNDHLEGGAGNDTYLFGRGDGRDTIFNNDFAAGRHDILRFTGDIRPDEIRFERVNSDLYLKLAGTTDWVNIRYFFSVEGSSSYALNEVHFSDGTIWTPADLAAKALTGDTGNNRLQAYQSGSTLRGGGGNDNLYGDKGDDTLYGDSGSDGLYGGGGDDVLIGGRGNDHLEGGAGNDTYLFGRGDGRDTIFNNDFAAGRRDILRFTGDIRPDEIRFERVNSDLYLKLTGTTDRVNIRYFFSAEGSSSYALNEVHFSDGTIWTPADLAAKALTGDTGNNRLQAYQSGSTLRGGGGNDNLYGDKGGDTLYGDSGSDGLYGGGGDDVLIGGRGNDHLEGGAGNDTYLFGRGDGQDTILNNDFAAGRRDILRFTGDIRPDEIRFERVNSDLYLKLAGTTDRVNIRYFFSAEGSSIYALNEVCFSDGTVWTPADLVAKALIGDAGNNRLQAYQSGSTLRGGGGNDNLYGDKGDDTLYGDSGSDGLYGGKGDDVLIGGRGNDHLEGGAGNDTYLFGRGDGRDTIFNNDFAAGRHDILRFTGDIRPDEIRFERVNSDLYLKLAGTTDRVNIRYFFSVEGSSSYALNEVHFSDGTVWTPADLAAKALTGDTGNNRLQAYQSGSTLRGGGGNDNLYGDKGDDTLYGDSGSDGLYGGGGDDVLIGGRGNDHLEGGAGNDTYLFGRGDGQDTILNNDFAAGRRDILRFTGDIRPDEIRFERVNSDLYLKLAGTTDRVNIRYFFSAEGSSSYALDEVHFSDGTVWTSADLLERALPGTRNVRFVSPLQDNIITNSLPASLSSDDLSLSSVTNINPQHSAGDEDSRDGDWRTGQNILPEHDVAGSNTVGDNLSSHEPVALYDGKIRSYEQAKLKGIYTRHTSSCMCVGCARSPESLTRGVGEAARIAAENNSAPGVLLLREGIVASDITIARSENDLLIHLHDDADNIRLNNYFSASSNEYHISGVIQFADGMRWLPEDIRNSLDYDIPLPMPHDVQDNGPSISQIIQSISQFAVTDDDDSCGFDQALPLALPRHSAGGRWPQA